MNVCHLYTIYSWSLSTRHNCFNHIRLTYFLW